MKEYNVPAEFYDSPNNLSVEDIKRNGYPKGLAKLSDFLNHPIPDILDRDCNEKL